MNPIYLKIIIKKKYFIHFILNFLILFIIYSCGKKPGSDNNQNQDNGTRISQPDSSIPRALPDSYLQQCDCDYIKILNLKLFPQESDNWCWAACMQITINNFDKNFSQCEIVSKVLNTDCKPGNRFSDQCDQQNYPDFDKFNFNGPLILDWISWDSLRCELYCRPVLAIIEHAGGGLHAVMVYGYFDSLNTHYICYYDPLPMNKGQCYLLPFDDFLYKQNTFSLFGYYTQVYPRSISENQLRSEPNSFKALRDTDDLFEPAFKSQYFPYPSGIYNDTLKINNGVTEAIMGFSQFRVLLASHLNLLKSYNGSDNKPIPNSQLFFPEFIIRKDSLSHFRGRLERDSILTPNNILFFPSMTYKLAIEVAYQNGKWKTISLQDSVIAHAIGECIHKDTSILREKLFRADIPFLNLNFIGYTTRTNTFFIPLFDYKTANYNLTAYNKIDADTILSDLVILAGNNNNKPR